MFSRDKLEYRQLHLPDRQDLHDAEMLGRPESEKPTMIIAVGHAAKNATVPAVAKIKKPLGEILSVR